MASSALKIAILKGKTITLETVISNLEDEKHDSRACPIKVIEGSLLQDNKTIFLEVKNKIEKLLNDEAKDVREAAVSFFGTAIIKCLEVPLTR
ncbi:MAG: hypothetical protein Q6362_011710 [Candidatus Wukongarchaeota archaeon]|nr:hypothetical protein [Candidatus Wukongarchaeota archaeon]